MPNHSNTTSAAAIAKSAAATIFLTGVTASAALLLYLSYRFEAVAYQQILGQLGSQTLLPWGNMTVAEGLAAGLNSAKAGLIFVVAERVARRNGRALFARLSRAFLLFISVVMTLLVVGGHTISPNAEARLASARTEVQDRNAALVAQLNTGAETRRATLVADFEAETARLSADHFKRIDQLQACIDAERQIGTGNSFYGPRYKDCERNIEIERASFTARIDKMRAAQETALIAIETDRGARLAQLTKTAKTELATVRLASVFDAEEAQNPFLLRFLEIARLLAPEGQTVNVVMLTVFLAVIISLGVEIPPIMMLGHVAARIASGPPTPDTSEQSPHLVRLEPERATTPEPANTTDRPEAANAKAKHRGSGVARPWRSARSRGA